jgi:hypothetical protein
MRAGRLLLLATMLLSCGDAAQGRPPTGLEALGIEGVEPSVVLPGTTMVVKGRSFLGDPLGLPWLRLDGTFAGRGIAADLPATFVDYDELEVTMNDQAYAILGAREASFEGVTSVIVDFLPDGSRHQSSVLARSLVFVEHLEPIVDRLQDTGAIFVNDAIPIEGDGLLLGGGEGTTVAVVEGCLLPVGSETCVPGPVVEIPVSTDEPFDRTRGSFPFSPKIAGIRAGRFEGWVQLRNQHAGGHVTESGRIPVVYDLLETTIAEVGDGGSLGQFVPVRGGGFIGGDEGLTLLQIEGQFFKDDGVGGIDVPPIPIIPEFVSGAEIRYVINEEDALGIALESEGGVRYAAGTFDGTVSAIVQYGADELLGPPTPLTFRIEPVKQVVYLVFNASYVESLRKFGLRALDRRIRDRVIEVLRRDYQTINVEIREELPEDFLWYTQVEISGPDPNGLGLLGYDNTPGKDRNNERLYDRIGGVNALTQEDGYAGYGGVFIESLFTFSSHPPSGPASDVANVLFDQIFDPFRPDRGRPVTSEDEAAGGIPVLTTSGGCPTSERRQQVACAVWALGSLIGTTTSHELAHSLGLADPVGTRFHNLGDAENRLMDSGGARPFEERAELMGQGPSVFCDSEYEYLRRILPTDAAPTTFDRPRC